LRFDQDDREAASIASRLKAALEVEGVRLSLEQPAREAASISLLAHRPATPDALSSLIDRLSPMHTEAAGELDLLERAFRQTDPAVRDEMAWWAESSLMRDGRIIPLVRLDAWLVRRHALRGVRNGANGELLLGEAWWLP
jgi:hypothetical protein